jgi:3-keto-disaccharide hydrolase
MRPARTFVVVCVAVCIAIASIEARAEPEELTRVLVLSPKAADSADTTHAALLITHKSYSGRISFGGRVQTVKQLRVGSLPNPWECAWLVWNYQDEQHFYYVAIKPSGWEIGKRDPAYPGGQRFLASGQADFPIGTWHSFAIAQEGDVIAIRLNGVEIASYADTERPYTHGNLGLYAEDAEVQLDDVSAPFTDDFEDYPPLTADTEGLALKNWVVKFLGYGHVAIADRKR